MEPMSRAERAALCNTALEVGPDAPTLCAGWTVRDLVAHLLVRERRLVAATGIVVPPLAPVTRWASGHVARQDFTTMVERVRTGPPLWSPFAVPALDRAVNGLEMFVHHEDIRRAQPGWEPRDLGLREQRAVFEALPVPGRLLARAAGVPVDIRWEASDGVVTTTLRRGSAHEEPAVMTGEPAELALRLFGRDAVRGVTYDGPPAAAATLQQASFGM